MGEELSAPGGGVTTVELQGVVDDVTALQEQAIASVEVDETGHLKFTRENDEELDAGIVIPDDIQEISGLVKIAEVTLGAASPSIDIATIPQDYKVLKIFASLRGDSAAAFVGLLMNLNNNVTDANYYRQYLQGSAAVASAAEVLGAANSRQAALIPSGTAPAGHFAQLEVTITDYASATKRKTVEIRCSGAWGTATGTIGLRVSSMFFNVAAAIDRVALAVAAGNLAVGSSMSVYGVKSAFG